MKRKTLDEFTDAELGAMVRESIYVKGTTFGMGERDARFLIVFAVPYGPIDTVRTLPEAIDAFAQLIQDDDWREREFQVYDHKTGKRLGITPETLEVNRG